MKTYSRKNSSYLKKAFIASNFNEMCRLCLSELDLGLTPIFQESGKISYQEWIQYSVDVFIEEGDGLPSNVCEECLALVEQTYLFKKKCKASDSKLREHLELLELNKEEKLSETVLIDLAEDHQNFFQREESSESKCDESSAVDSGGTNEKHFEKEKSEDKQIVQKEEEEEEEEEIEIEIEKEKEKEKEKEIEIDIDIDKDKEKEKEKEIDIDIDVDVDIDKEKEKEKDEEKKEELEKEDEVLKEEPKKVLLKEEETNRTLKKEEVTQTNTQMLYSDVDFEYLEPREKVVKRYILKGEKKADDQEEDLSVCEVVPLDVRNEDSVSSNMKETQTYTTLECPSQNGHASELVNPQEKRIQEIYRLWDNVDEEEDEEEEEEEEEEDEEEELEEEEEFELEQKQFEEKDENTQQEIMILDVSWEDNTDKNVKRKNTGLLEVNVEKNGVLQLHRVYKRKTYPKAMETSRERQALIKVEAVVFKCFACGKDFSKGVELKAHLSKFHHEVSDAAFCETCGKSFVCSNNLKRHMGIHTGYKPHKCKICGRTFSQGSILKRHVFTHETLKPFNCQICGKGYTQKMNLLSHFRNHGFRTEGENFTCQYCNKTFVHQSGLSRHVKLHKGIRFSCDQCDKSFRDSSALARHIKTIHKNY